MVKERKRYAAITFDVDTLMADMSLCGVDEAKSSRIRQISYSDIVPRILGLLSELKIKATFFIVGKDGLEPGNRKVIDEVCKGGHEIANHSFLHDRNLCNFNDSDFIKDVSESEKILSDITGRKISGFRMPGSTIKRGNLLILEQMGYLYDSSLNASLVYNLSKACYVMISGSNRKVPCQDFASWHAPNQPYYPGRDNIYKSSDDHLGLLEFPITLIPGLSFPFMNYFLLAAGKFVSRRCYEMVKAKAGFINLVMHDNEAAVWEKYSDFRLAYRLCGWHIKKDIKKREVFIKQLIEDIKQDYNIVTLEEYSQIALRSQARLNL